MLWLVKVLHCFYVTIGFGILDTVEILGRNGKFEIKIAKTRQLQTHIHIYIYSEIIFLWFVQAYLFTAGTDFFVKQKQVAFG